MVPTGTDAVVTRFVASDVNAACVPSELTVGSELTPLAAFPKGSELTTAVIGKHDACPRQVLRTKTSAAVFKSVRTRLRETEANATYWPVLLVDGPTVDAVRPSAPLVQEVEPPQRPLAACEPSAARSTSMGKPNKCVGLTANVRIFEGPPPGPAFTTVI